MTDQLCVTVNVVSFGSGKIVKFLFVLRMGPIQYLLRYLIPSGQDLRMVRNPHHFMILFKVLRRFLLS